MEPINAAAEAAVEAPKLTPSEKFTAIRAAAEAAKTPEAIAAKAAADAAKVATPVAVAEPEKRASGDERKFRSLLSKRDREIGELRARLDAALPKPAAAAAAAPDAAPKREAFATQELFDDAKLAYGVKRELEKTTATAAQAKEISDTLAGYNALIAAAPEKYPDWAETLAAGKDGALTADLNKECP